jgi:hypothetical protein
MSQSQDIIQKQIHQLTLKQRLHERRIDQEEKNQQQLQLQLQQLKDEKIHQQEQIEQQQKNEQKIQQQIDTYRQKQKELLGEIQLLEKIYQKQHQILQKMQSDFFELNHHQIQRQKENEDLKLRLSEYEREQIILQDTLFFQQKEHKEQYNDLLLQIQELQQQLDQKNPIKDNLLIQPQLPPTRENTEPYMDLKKCNSTECDVKLSPPTSVDSSCVPTPSLAFRRKAIITHDYKNLKHVDTFSTIYSSYSPASSAETIDDEQIVYLTQRISNSNSNSNQSLDSNTYSNQNSDSEQYIYHRTDSDPGLQ